MFIKKIALVLILKEIIGILSYNVALRKQGNLCGSMNLNWKFFDGDISNAHKIFFVNKYCVSKEAKITIILEGAYYVHYVILYLGNSKNVQPLSYYSVSTSVDGKRFSCGQYRKRIMLDQTNDGLRINCKLMSHPVSEVAISMSTNADLAFSEVEIHTLASGWAKEPVLFYRGCFELVRTREVTPLTGFSACWRRCQIRGFILMAIKLNKECHCAVEFDASKELLSSKCDICSKPSKPCGGYEGSYSVYIVNIQLPYYEGCSEGELENGIPGDPIESKKMNVSMCRKHCQFSNFAWLNNTACRCSNSSSPVDPTSYICNIFCPGDSNEFCGGYNRFSVFGTCRKEHSEFLTCDKLFNCNGTVNIYGQCRGKCLPGFIDEYCLGRDLEIVNQEIDPLYPTLIGLGVAILLIVICVYFRMS